MLSKPKVSVLLATHNMGQFLEEAVASIRAQTEQQWELVICDDASTDGTAEICERLRKTDSRIVIVHHSTNRGLSVARNTAFAASSGEYIAILDADDTCGADRLAVQLEWIAKYPSELIMSGYHHFGAGVSTACDLHVPYELANAALWACPLICGATMMLHRSIFEKLKGYRPEIRDFQDLDIVLRGGLAGHPFRTIPAELYHYRIHGNSLTGKNRNDFYRRINQYLTTMWNTNLADRNSRGKIFQQALRGLTHGHWPLGQLPHLRRKASSVALHLAIRLSAMGDVDWAKELLGHATKLCWWRGDSWVSRVIRPTGFGVHLTSFGDRLLPRLVLTRQARITAMI